MTAIGKPRILLLLFTAVVPMALSAVMLVGRAIVRELMEERLSAESLVTVIVRRDDIRWHRSGREAIIEGRLFDVVSQTQEGGVIRLRGIFDDGETWLQDALAHSGGSGSGAGATLMHRILLPCLGLVCEPAPRPLALTSLDDLPDTFYSCRSISMLSPGHPASVFQPPPFSCRSYC
jgi:hypothetical protein